MSVVQSREQSGSRHENEINGCDGCGKFFTSSHAYQTHLKMNNCGQNRSSKPKIQIPTSKPLIKKPKSVPFKNKALQTGRNELEDTICVFLGQIGEQHSDRTAAQEKPNGQNSYSINSVIRTPHQDAIKCSCEVPQDFLSKSKHKQMLILLLQELTLLEEKIEVEKDKWQLRDPMASDDEINDQFSLMDIKKLITNYPKRNITLKYPHFSIFLLWVGKISKAPAFRELFVSLGSFLADFVKENQNVKSQESWTQHCKNYQSKPLDKELTVTLRIFDQKNVKKLYGFYGEWVRLFKAIAL